MKRARILVIDDSKVMVLRITHELEGAGYEVICEDNGYRGIERAKKDSPDLIIADYTLPGMTGDRLIEKLKADLDTAEIPIIVHSSQADPELIEQLTELGAAAHVPKSGDWGALIARVQAVLESDFEVEF